jgi:CheY-like chemotaxis protein
MRKHFFVIDDDEDEVQFISAALHEMKADHKCTWAKSGELALNQLQHLEPDVIFLDLNMTGMNGLQCLQAIKRLPHCNHVPVILHSTIMNAELRHEGLQLGAHDCLKKPDSINKLMTVLKQFFFRNLVRGL